MGTAAPQRKFYHAHNFPVCRKKHYFMMRQMRLFKKSTQNADALYIFARARDRELKRKGRCRLLSQNTRDVLASAKIPDANFAIANFNEKLRHLGKQHGRARNFIKTCTRAVCISDFTMAPRSARKRKWPRERGRLFEECPAHVCELGKWTFA